MDTYPESGARYRRLFRLTVLPLAGCVIYLLLIGTIDMAQSPVVALVLGTLDTACFAAFAVNGVMLGRFRCPRCAGYFNIGRRVAPPSGRGPCCRHCGLQLFSERPT